MIYYITLNILLHAVLHRFYVRLHDSFFIYICFTLGLHEYLLELLHNTLYPITCLITWFWLALHGLCPLPPLPPEDPLLRPLRPRLSLRVLHSLPPSESVAVVSHSDTSVAATSIVEDPVTECRRSAGVHCCQRRGLGTSRGVLIAPVNGCPRHGSGPG